MAGTRNRFQAFATAWALSSLVTTASLPDKRFGPIVALLALLLIAFPGSVAIFLLLCASVFARILWFLPDTPNHFTLELLACGAFLSAGLSLWRRRGLDSDGLLERAAPTARVLMLVVYLFATVDKINWDYLSPHGCGWALVSPFFGGMDFASRYPIAWQIGTYGSLFMEGFLLIGLAVPALRSKSLMAGTVFHTMLALIPHVGVASFSGLTLSLYVLFMPENTNWQAWRLVPNIERVWKRVVVVFAGAAVWAVLSYVAASWVTGFAYDALRQQGLVDSRRYLTGIYFSVFVFFPMGLWMLRNVISTFWFTQKMRPELRMWGPAWMAIFPALALLNGLCPFIGLKTHTSFGMFSNITTEQGQTNHLFIPASVQIFQYQTEWIHVTKAPPSFEYGTRIPDMVPVEFRRRFERIAPGDTVEFERNGVPGRLTKGVAASVNADLERPLNLLERKVLRFRPLIRGPQPCRQ